MVLKAFSQVVRKPAVLGALLSQAVFGVCLALTLFKGFESAELFIYDALTRGLAERSKSAAPVSLVVARESDLNRFNWPLSDGTLGELLTKISEQHPRAIGVDIYRDAPRPPGTEALDSAITSFDNIFMVYKFPDASGSGLDERGNGIPAPLSAQERDQIGFADMMIDQDGAVRRGLLFLDNADGQSGTSLALQMAARYLAEDNICLQSDGTPDNFLAFGPCPTDDTPTNPALLIRIPPFQSNDGAYVNADDGGYQTLIDYRSGLNAFPMVSFSDVLDGTVPPDTFTGRVVIVGVASESVKDFFLTPLERSATAQPLFGVELHGHLVSQFIRHATKQNPPIRSLTDTWELVILWLWCVIGTAVGFLLRAPLLIAGALLVGLAAIFGVAVLMLSDYLWIPAVAPAVGWLLSAFTSTSYVSYREQQDRQTVMGLFARHVSKDVAQELWEQRDEFMNGNRPKSQRLVATVLFSDLKGFTSVSENATPEALMEWLNTYMETMTEVIIAHGGVIDKFIGDAIMVVFGVPRMRTSEAEIAADAKAAVTCALAMSARLIELNEGWRQENKPEVGMRIGIHTGPLVAGALGGKDRVNYTVIGDTVNTAARLESYDKAVVDPADPDAPSRIIIGAATHKMIGEGFATTPVGTVTVKGKQESLMIYLVPIKQKKKIVG